MKRLVHYKLNFGSKWLTFSGVMMGIAFFLQALEFLGIRQLNAASVSELLLNMILPMVLEALWFVPLRSELWHRAEIHGILGALLYGVLFAQAILAGSVFQIILCAVFFVLGSAALILITWGFIPHRALGMLVFTAAAVVQVLSFALPRYVTHTGYLTLVQVIQPVCMILGMMLFFGGIQLDAEEEAE